jgi:hypothetical protein
MVADLVESREEWNKWIVGGAGFGRLIAVVINTGDADKRGKKGL